MIAPLLLQDPAAQAPRDALAGTPHVEETFRFLAAPPLWVLVLVLLPASVLFAYWAYSGLHRLELRTRVVLSSLRWLALLLCLALVCEPVFEITTYRKTESQVHVLVDDSASMLRKDRYPDGEQQAALAALVGGSEPLSASTRLQLVQRELERPAGLLEQLQQSHAVRLFRVERKPAQSHHARRCPRPAPGQHQRHQPGRCHPGVRRPQQRRPRPGRSGTQLRAARRNHPHGRRRRPRASPQRLDRWPARPQGSPARGGSRL
jgi:hypothetical protein